MGEVAAQVGRWSATVTEPVLKIMNLYVEQVNSILPNNLGCKEVTT